MKTMTLYIAYDDTAFTNEAECHAYEEKAFNLINEAVDTYSFYDRDKNIIFINYNNIEEYWGLFDMAIDDCEYVKVARDVSRELHEFLFLNVGTCVPEKEGFYKYDWHKCEWVSAN